MKPLMFIVEAEAIVNCRLLTEDIMNYPDMYEILTPNRLLLTMECKIILAPPGDFQRGVCIQERYGAESITSPTNSGIIERRNVCNRWSQEWIELTQEI